MSEPELATPARIVAEVTRIWPTQNGAEDTLISQRFEHVIAVNAERGYQLEAWQFSQAITANGLCETIIAVFKRVTTTPQSNRTNSAINCGRFYEQ